MPIETIDFPLPATRPTNSQINSNALVARFGLTMPNWRDAMELCIDEILKTQ